MKLPTVSINKDILKIIALVTMTIDHIGQYLTYVPFADAYRYVGRISFPIFVFLLMEHLYKKQIYKKYIARLSIFGVLTFVVLLPFSGLIKENPIYPINILLTFLNAILFLLAYEWIKKEDVSKGIKIIAQTFAFICFGMVALACQYGISGFCYMLAIYYYFQKSSRLRYIFIMILSILINVTNYWWIVSLLTTLFLLQIRENKTYPRLLKHWWIFYVYYPLHLFVIMLISYLCQI